MLSSVIRNERRLLNENDLKIAWKSFQFIFHNLFYVFYFGPSGYSFRLPSKNVAGSMPGYTNVSPPRPQVAQLTGTAVDRYRS